jgi:hypothetical protein
MGRAVRIVLDLRNPAGDPRFIPLEIDDAIETLMTSAATPDRPSLLRPEILVLASSSDFSGTAFGVNSSRVRYV